MNIADPANSRPYCGAKNEFKGWFAEAVWGHRLEPQGPSALLLEFLGVVDAMWRGGRLFEETMPDDDLRYSARQSLHLRCLLFHNPSMEAIRDRHQGDDEGAWDAWLKDIRDWAFVGDHFDADFSYLKARFPRFADAVARVVLLRRITMDPGSDRGWTGQLLFPIGPDALYEPLNAKDLTRERVLFTRTGEIAYLMLSRASDSARAKLRGLGAICDPNTPRNRLLSSLLPDGGGKMGSDKGGSYLPYVTHPAFDRMAEDVGSLLDLGLPNQDVLEPLKHILAFNLYLYGIETANHWLGRERIPPCVCEIPGRMDVVRRAAISTCEENEGLGLLVVRQLAEAAFTSDPDLNDKLRLEDLTDEDKAALLVEHVAQQCAVPPNAIHGASPREVREKLIAVAEGGFRDGMASALRGLGRAAGFTDRRGTNKIRYAPTDKLLRALVLANVRQPVEEEELLRAWNKRYSLIFGPREADGLPERFRDEGNFSRNRERLTHRLSGLGLAQRMSDACTYVRNPYHRAL